MEGGGGFSGGSIGGAIVLFVPMTLCLVYGSIAAATIFGMGRGSVAEHGPWSWCFEALQVVPGRVE